MNADEFLTKHGFPGTPAGDRMKADLEQVLSGRDKYWANRESGADRSARAYGWEVGVVGRLFVRWLR